MRQRFTIVFGALVVAVVVAVAVAFSIGRTGFDDLAPRDTHPVPREESNLRVDPVRPIERGASDSPAPTHSAATEVARESLAPVDPVRPTVTGFARDPHTDFPIAGVEIAFASGAAFPEVVTVTAGDGSFSIEIDPTILDPHRPARRSCEVRVSRKGWVTSVARISPEELASGAEVTLYAAPQGVVLLRIRDEAGQPAAVDGIGLAGDDSTSSPSDASCPLVEGSYTLTSTTVVVDELTIARGEYEVIGLVHGRAESLVIWLADERRYRVGLAAPSRCGEVRSVDLVIPSLESRIRGRLSRSGESYAGVVTWRGPTLGGGGRAAADGTFELVGVERGLVTLFARDGNTTRSIETLVDVPGDRTIEKDLDIRVSPLIRGIVRGARGRKLRVTATARYGIDPVWFEAKASRRRDPLPIPTPDVSADVYPDGSFELRVRDSGTDYVLEIESRTPREFGPDRVGYVVALPGDTAVVLEATTASQNR